MTSPSTPTGTSTPPTRWYPRILRLKKGATALDVWVNDPVLGAGQWHLNGIDVDQSSGNVFVFDQGTDAQSGKLFRISIAPATGNAGTPTQITLPAALRHPDGLKVIAPNLIAMGEAAGAVSQIKVTNNTGVVTSVIAGLRGVATLALHQGSAWAVEGQGDHFWDAADAGPNANPPFRLMEIPLAVGAGLGNISIGTAASRFFPEGVTSDDSGNFFVGSMDLGSIYRVAAGTTTPTPFIVPDATNDLVSVLGLYADNARNRLWVCSSDAGNAQRSGSAPVALKSFNLTTGAYVNSWAWPAPPAPLTPIAGATVNGFCNDITIEGGDVYATDSWYPRVLRLANGGAGGAQLTNWLVSTTVFPQDQWHLNGIDVDPTGTYLYVVENHPGHLYRVTIGTGSDGGGGHRDHDAEAALRSGRTQGPEPDHAADRRGQRHVRHRPHRHDGGGPDHQHRVRRDRDVHLVGRQRLAGGEPGGSLLEPPAARTVRPPPSRSGWSRRRCRLDPPPIKGTFAPVEAFAPV